MTTRKLGNSPWPILGWGAGWLVTDKPAGLTVHNQPGKDLCSQFNAYLTTSMTAAKAVDYDPHYGMHPVHRLDKSTSGVILLSCRREVFDDYSRQFASGKVSKHYTALVHGMVDHTDDWQAWNWPLTAKAAGRRNPQGQGPRQKSRTRYRLIQHTRHYSVIECRLDTGRTHQIRRHATLAGHPLLGDRRYGSNRACRYLEEHHNFKRIGLHATHLTITPPGQSSPQTLESPNLPKELSQLIDKD